MPDERLTFILEARDLASGTTRRVRGEMSGLGSAVGGLKKQFIGGVAAGNLLASGVSRVADAFVDSAGEAVQFQTNMLNVNSISKLSTQAFNEQSQGVLDLSKTLPQSATTLSQGLYDIASSGFQGADGMKVLEASARAASAGLSTTAVSSAGLTAVLNSYHLSADQATRISDIMFQTVNRGVVTFDELAGEIGKTTALASPLGLSFEEVSAAISLMTRNGIDAANATTQINAIMQNLLKPSREAVTLAEKLGLGWDAQALKARGLTGVLSDMMEKTHGNAHEMAVLLGNARAIRGAMVLAADGGGAFNAELNEMEKAGGATNSALSEQQKGLAYQATVLGNKFQALVDSVVLDLIPALTELVGMAGQVVDFADQIGDAFGRAENEIGSFADNVRHDMGVELDPKEWAFAIHDWATSVGLDFGAGAKASEDAVAKMRLAIGDFHPGDELGRMFGDVPKRIAQNEAAFYAAMHRTVVTPTDEAANEARAHALHVFGLLPKEIGDAVTNGLPGIQDGLKDLKDLIKHSLSDNEKEAKLRGILTSKALARGLRDERFDVRAAARELQRETRQELRELESGAKDAAADGAAAYAEFLRKGKAAAEAAGDEVATAAGNGLRLNAYNAGTTVTKTYIAGIVDELIAQIPNVNNAAYRFLGGTFGNSLPKSGPFSGPHLTSAARSVAKHYAGQLAAGLEDEQGTVQGALAVGGGLPTAGGGSIGAAGGLTIVFQSQLPYAPSQGQELARRIGPELVRWMRQNRA